VSVYRLLFVAADSKTIAAIPICPKSRSTSCGSMFYR